jgi:hypothetical protein
MDKGVPPTKEPDPIRNTLDSKKRVRTCFALHELAFPRFRLCGGGIVCKRTAQHNCSKIDVAITGDVYLETTSVMSFGF